MTKKGCNSAFQKAVRKSGIAVDEEGREPITYNEYKKIAKHADERYLLYIIDGPPRYTDEGKKTTSQWVNNWLLAVREELEYRSENILLGVGDE